MIVLIKLAANWLHVMDYSYQVNKALEKKKKYIYIYIFTDWEKMSLGVSQN